mgnify:CR=1 FL=1
MKATLQATITELNKTKEPYQKPSLIHYGQVKDLTLDFGSFDDCLGDC